MKLKRNTIAAAILTASLIASYAYASDATPSAKKHPVTKKAKAPAKPSVEDQLQTLRQALESQGAQINGLKSDLADKDARLKKAEQAASDAEVTAAKAQAAAANQNKAVEDNTAAVTTLESAVTGLKANQTSLAITFSDETSKIKKAIESPTVLHFKGIALVPYGFFNGESAYRTHATGGEEATPWSSIPYEHADSYSMSETMLSGRQSRIGLNMEGKVGWGTVRAYLEGDFLGAGATSNDNQSTSYIFRQRIASAEVETNNHWTFSGGQGWTLATEDKVGITTAAANQALPMMIDPNYVAGLVWARMGYFRLTRSFGNAAFAISAENPQLLYTATLAGNTPYAVVGSAGLSASFLNQTISACSPSTSIVNYTNQKQTDSAGNTVNIAVPVYKTVNSCANLANISFNEAPDMLVKAAFDPGFGHYEVFGISRFFHQTVYPGETTNSNLYGGLKDIVSGATVAPALTTAGAYSNSITLGGVGGSMRLPIVANKFTFGAKGLFGPGVGHFGASTLSDATSNFSGELVAIHNLSGLMTAEITPNPRLQLYFYYGGDYAGREDESNPGASTLGAPSAAQNAAGAWGGTWKAPSLAAVGYGSRLLSNSACNSNTAPGYNGSSTGYYTGASCGAQTRDAQEATGGYWYDIYKGDRGRLRQGIQYSYAVREGWSGANGIGAKGVDSMVFTSLRYFLP
jgi:multidrug efflux pump subunit AcrA (membrane-fusion protein)